MKPSRTLTLARPIARPIGAALLTVISTMVALSGPPASAVVPGRLVVSATTPVNSAAVKTISVSCPPGRSVIGTGYRIAGANGQAKVSDLIPAGPTVSLRVVEIAGAFPGNWQATVIAVCADIVPTIVSATTLVNSANVKSVVTPNCPVNAPLLTGTGYQLAESPANQVVVDTLLPSASLSTVTLRASESIPNLANWQATVYGICTAPIGQTL
ncbi:MAG: hypothetical protein ACRCYU_20860, partial [Nocardioides sp.]